MTTLPCHRLAPLLLLPLAVGCGPGVERLGGAEIDVLMSLSPPNVSMNVRGTTKETCTDFRYDVRLAGVTLVDVSAGAWRDDGAFNGSPTCLSTTYRTTASPETIVAALESGEALRFSDGQSTVTARPPFQCARVWFTSPSKPVRPGETFELEYTPIDAFPPLTLKQLPAGCTPWVPSSTSCRSSNAVALGEKVRDGLVRFRVQPGELPGTYDVYGASTGFAYVQCPGFAKCNWTCNALTDGSFTLTVQ
ncbi:MAG: hypothetical protein JNJ54_31450 [Myxococcaceae bacterium]|nr:hypothetical protein [Myxococcaceae bacterium]